MTENFVGFKVDGEIHRYLEQKPNTSEYLRRLIRSDMKGASADLVGLRAQAETLEKQAQQHREQKEMYRKRANQVREMIAKEQERNDVELETALQKLEKTPRDPSNPAIKKWAAKLGMSPDELVSELERENGGR